MLTGRQRNEEVRRRGTSIGYTSWGLGKQMTRGSSEGQIKTRKGFTIVEVTLAMAFVATLLISIALVTSNIIAIYQKGLTLKSVDSVGRNLIEEFISTINAAPSVDTANLCRTHSNNEEVREQCLADNAYKFIFQSRQPEDEAIQYGGVLCTGKYSYLWNTQYGLDNGEEKALRLKYTIAGDDGNKTIEMEKPPKLIRFEDRNYLACSVSVSGDYELVDKFKDVGTGYEVDVTTLENGQVNVIAKPEENFLDSADLPLALYELTVFPIAQDSVTLRSFFSGTFILATEQGEVGKRDASVTRTDDYCQVEDTDASLVDIGSRFSYCAINKFNFAARTAGI